MMSRTMTEARLPKRVDATKLVELNQQFRARIDIKSLARIQDATAHAETPVEVELDFQRDEEGNRTVSGQCSTHVVMVCQRCLGTVGLDIGSQFHIGLVFSDEQAKHLPKRLEPAEMDENGQLDLWELIEDEILLNLPEFPMHPEGECRMYQVESDNEPEAVEKKENPFDILATLKQKQ